MKKIAPIIITIIVSCFIGLYAFITFGAGGGGPLPVRIILIAVGIGSVCLIGAMIYTLIHRLKEIDREEKDDLSKY